MASSQTDFPRASAQVLFSANFVAIVVAVLFQWRLSDLFTLYWLELVALAILTIVQMQTARAEGAFAKSPGYLIVLFLAHYGTFCVMYRATIAYFFKDSIAQEWFWAVVWVPLAALIVAHVVSFSRDYLPREAAATAPFHAMWIPYLRELPVHVPLLVAVAVVQGGSGARNEVLVFGASKMMADVIAHAVYHSRIATRRHTTRST